MLPQKASPKVYHYLMILDALGKRTVYLKGFRYRVGGSDDCDIQLNAPTADECQTLFVRSGNGYQIKEVDLHRGGDQRIPLSSYTLQPGDRIVFAPLAFAVYYQTTEPPPEGSDIPAKLPAAPSSFPSVEEAEPVHGRVYRHA